MLDLNIDFFKFKYNDVKPKQGKVLISEPFLNDMYFKRSVVFLTEHTKEGSVGFVLNKPVNLKLNEVLQDFPFLRAEVSLGGPVNTNSVHYIHTYGDIIPESVEVLKGLYWGGDFNYIKKIIDNNGFNPEKIRFFLGYSGWASGQLQDELSENSWIVTDIDANTIMKTDDKDNIWKQTLTKMGKKFTIWANSPSNPSLN